MPVKPAANPTKADILRLLVVQAHTDAEKRLREFEHSGNANAAMAVRGEANGASQELGRLRGKVEALAQLKSKVAAYLDRGDLSVLIR